MTDDIHVRAQDAGRRRRRNATDERGDWQPGDLLIAPANRRYRVTGAVPLATVEELVDGAVAGSIEVEPL